MTSTPRHTLRRMTAALTLTVPVLVILISRALWAGKLPEQLATHWSGFGTPDGYMGTQANFAVTMGLAAVGLLAAIAIALRSVNMVIARSVAAVAGSIAGIGTGVWLISAGLSVSAGQPSQATLGGWVLVPIILAGYGAVPWALLNVATLSRGPLLAPATSLSLTQSERVTWVGVMNSRIFSLTGLAMLAVGVILVLASALAGGLIMLVVGAVMSVFSHLRVKIDYKGLQVRSHLAHIRLKSIALSRIHNAESAEIQPGNWGGWGYRVQPGQSAIITRRGPGLVLNLVSGRRFAITIDEPAARADLINALIVQRTKQT